MFSLVVLVWFVRDLGRRVLGGTDSGVVLVCDSTVLDSVDIVKARTACLRETPTPNIWTLTVSVHQMSLHNERSA